MADVVNITKRLIGKEDINFDNAGTNATANFVTPSGETKTLTKVNASHIPLTSGTQNKTGAANVDAALSEISTRIDGFRTLDIMTADTTISFTATDSAETIQSIINQQKKNLNGHILTFNFPSSLTQNMYSTLTWKNFFNGTVIVEGGSANNKIDVISRQNSMSSIFNIQNCQCEFRLCFFNFLHQNITYAIEAQSVSSLLVMYCNFTGVENSTSAAVFNKNSDILFSSCQFINDEQYLPNNIPGDITQKISEHNNSSSAHAQQFAKYLPISGGTLTGTLKVANGNSIMQAADNGVLRMYGGTTYDSPALFLFGKDTSGYNGLVYLRAYDGTNTVDLICNPDGSLRWNGKDITLGYPNYAAPVKTSFSALAGGSYTAPADGFVTVVGSNTDNGGLKVYVNSSFVYHQTINADNYSCCPLIPVKKGDIVKAEVVGAANTTGYFRFFPIR